MTDATGQRPTSHQTGEPAGEQQGQTPAEKAAADKAAADKAAEKAGRTKNQQ